MVGNIDGLIDEDVNYPRRLIAAAVLTDLHVLAGAPHAFDSLMPDTTVARRAQRILESWLAEHLNRGHSEQHGSFRAIRDGPVKCARLAHAIRGSRPEQ